MTFQDILDVPEERNKLIEDIVNSKDGLVQGRGLKMKFLRVGKPSEPDQFYWNGLKLYKASEDELRMILYGKTT